MAEERKLIKRERLGKHFTLDSGASQESDIAVASEQAAECADIAVVGVEGVIARGGVDLLGREARAGATHAAGAQASYFMGVDRFPTSLSYGSVRRSRYARRSEHLRPLLGQLVALPCVDYADILEYSVGRFPSCETVRSRRANAQMCVG